MVLKPSLVTCMSYIVFTVGFVGYAVAMIVMGVNPWWPVVLVVGLGVTLRFAVSYCRTLYMSKEGVTVQFLWIKKMYRWEELRYKRYLTYDGVDGSLERRCCYAAEFCTKDVKIPFWMSADEYSLLVHPFCFFYVYFPTPLSRKRRAKLLKDQDVFRAQLKEWGVEMTEDFRGLWT